MNTYDELCLKMISNDRKFFIKKIRGAAIRAIMLFGGDGIGVERHAPPEIVCKLTLPRRLLCL